MEQVDAHQGAVNKIAYLEKHAEELNNLLKTVEPGFAQKSKFLLQN